MRTFPFWLVLLVSLAGYSCTTIQTGSYAKAIDNTGRVTEQVTQTSGLKVSGTQVSELSSRYFGMLVVTIENTTPRWRRIHNLRVSLSPRALHEHVIIPAGAELNAWVDATLATSYYAKYDLGLLFRQLGLRDWSQRVTRNRPTPQAHDPAGLNTVGAVLTNPSTPQSYPNDHLLEGPIIVPPKLFAKRWLVLNTPPIQDQCIRGVDLEYDIEADGGPEAHERVWVAITNDASDWQPQACNKGKYTYGWTP